MGGNTKVATQLDHFFTRLNTSRKEPFNWAGDEPALGIPWEAFSDEGSPGQFELNLEPADPVTAADRQLLADLLTESEAPDRRFVFDIGLLARRLLDCTHWTQQQGATQSLPIGYFGASTGAATAIGRAF